MGMDGPDCLICSGRFWTACRNFVVFVTKKPILVGICADSARRFGVALARRAATVRELRQIPVGHRSNYLSLPLRFPHRPADWPVKVLSSPGYWSVTWFVVGSAGQSQAQKS